MTKAELIDKYWHEFLVWLTTAPTGKPHELVFWLEHRYPTEDNFWEYMVTVRGEELRIDS